MSDMEGASADLFLQNLLLSELDNTRGALLNRVAKLHCGGALLAFLVENANTMSTADGIAFRLHQPCEAVESDLHELLKLKMVRRMEVGVTLWRLTDEPDQCQVLHELTTWLDCWRARLDGIQHIMRRVS